MLHATLRADKQVRRGLPNLGSSPRFKPDGISLKVPDTHTSWMLCTSLRANHKARHENKTYSRSALNNNSAPCVSRAELMQTKTSQVGLSYITHRTLRRPCPVKLMTTKRTHNATSLEVEPSSSRKAMFSPAGREGTQSRRMKSTIQALRPR